MLRQRQVELFTAALLAIQEHALDMVDTVLEVDVDGTVTRDSMPDDC